MGFTTFRRGHDDRKKQRIENVTSMPLPKRCSASPSRVSLSSLSATFAPEAASLYCSASSIFTPAQQQILSFQLAATPSEQSRWDMTCWRGAGATLTFHLVKDRVVRLVYCISPVDIACTGRHNVSKQSAQHLCDSVSHHSTPVWGAQYADILRVLLAECTCD